jgi:hypothetical protein
MQRHRRQVSAASEAGVAGRRRHPRVYSLHPRHLRPLAERGLPSTPLLFLFAPYKPALDFTVLGTHYRM